MYRKYPIVHPKTGIFYTKVLLRPREAFGDGYAEGIRSKIGKVRQMAGELPKAAFGEIKYVQRSASPSKVTRGLGTDFSVGYKLGITDNEEDVQETVEGWITRLRNQVMAFSDVGGYKIRMYFHPISGASAVILLRQAEQELAELIEND